MLRRCDYVGMALIRRQGPPRCLCRQPQVRGSAGLRRSGQLLALSGSCEQGDHAMGVPGRGEGHRLAWTLNIVMSAKCIGCLVKSKWQGEARRLSSSCDILCKEPCFSTASFCRKRSVMGAARPDCCRGEARQAGSAPDVSMQLCMHAVQTRGTFLSKTCMVVLLLAGVARRPPPASIVVHT